MHTQQTAYERVKGEVHRIGWRIQYRAKTMKRREHSFYDMEHIHMKDRFTDRSENRMLLEQLMETLPHQGKVIIYRLYLQDQTESEVARQLNMSQQAVNRWKQRMIRQLSQIVNF